MPRGGFDTTTPEGKARQREIASKGGKAAHAKGSAHEWTPEQAREAGRKGGMVRQRKKAAPATETTTTGH